LGSHSSEGLWRGPVTLTVAPHPIATFVGDASACVLDVFDRALDMTPFGAAPRCGDCIVSAGEECEPLAATSGFSDTQFIEAVWP
jgi:hypothetical protein